MAGATPTLTSLKAKVHLAVATARSAAAINPHPPGPGVPGHPGQHRLGRGAEHGQDFRQAGGGGDRPLGQVGAGAEDGAGRREDHDPDRLVGRRLAQAAGQLVEELGRQRVAVVGRVHGQRADRTPPHRLHQRCGHESAV